jgi:hypothetical protein
MIDINAERVISLGQGARKFPSYREGRPVHPTTLYRWITDGVKLRDGSVVRLEGVRCGDRWLTSEEAIVRFIERQTPDLSTPRQAHGPSTASRERAAQRAGKQLEQIGI